MNKLFDDEGNEAWRALADDEDEAENAEDCEDENKLSYLLTQKPSDLAAKFTARDLKISTDRVRKKIKSV